MQNNPGLNLWLGFLVLNLACISIVNADFEIEETSNLTTVPVQLIPDLRDEEMRLKVQRGDIVAVPIPMSSPTFGTGLIVGSAYFYAQTEEQKLAQPASFTGVAGGYTTNDSWAIGVAQQSYWDEDNWRFNGGFGYVDFKFRLRDPSTDGEGGLDWNVDGGVFQAALSRRLIDSWYLGALVRYLDITQDLDSGSFPPDAGLESEIQSPGVGLTLEFDSRDVPTNAYRGRRFETKAIASKAKGEESDSYQSYYARFRSYHQLSEPLVLALDVNACTKSGSIPLWDTCRLNLRGFALTDYLGKKSLTGQAELRWKAWQRLGFVAFVGAGYIGTSFSDAGENERVPSYGVGTRVMVLKSKRINLRVDYARSEDEDAWYISVGEAF
jgi:hypothetical protein